MQPQTTINMVELERMIVACYNANEPLMALGRPGMGKTALFEHCAKTVLKIGYIDFRLSLRDPVEVGGMRVPDQKTGKLRHYIPDDLPDPAVHGKRGIIVFDEINVVAQLMQATAYGLIQERRNGSYRMAEGWVPMASGNNVGDRAAAQRLSTALANRFNVQHVTPHLPSWLNQYGSEHVDSRGCAFLRFRPRLFSLMPWEPIEEPPPNTTAPPVPRAQSEEVRHPSARSWTKAFKFIDEEPTFRRKIFTGYVGPDVASEFEAFWRVMEKAPAFDQIVADPKKAKLPEPSDVGTYYAVSGMLSRLADRKNFDPIMVYVNRMLPDYQVALVQDATRRQPGLKNTQAYGDWAVKHQDVTL
jgi:hypothetical protein